MFFLVSALQNSDPLANYLGDWSIQPGLTGLLFKIVLSVILAAVIGCERATKRHSAGLRTFILISLSCTVAMLLDCFLLASAGSNSFFMSAASIIALSIICVNSLLVSSRSQIKGLTTSVGMWACGMLGLTIGAGYYTAALIIFAALYITLSAFPYFEKYLKNRSNHFEIHLELTESKYLQDFVTTIRKLGMKIDDIEFNTAYAGSGLSVYTISISISNADLKKYKTHAELIEALRTLKYVYHIEEMTI
ncbi:MAG: MgtC/SapB family protein [Lachnospiraceae bacterium]|nr:MgtC/SapB family protein [Lachnospiraceae bacterium]